MGKVFEVGHSKVTGEYFIVSHDGTEGQDGFETKEAAEAAAKNAEQINSQEDYRLGTDNYASDF